MKLEGRSQQCFSSGFGALGRNAHGALCFILIDEES